MRTKSPTLHASYRWFPLWVLMGAALAALLLANSISNYFFVARRVQVDQVRRELSRQIALFDRQAHQSDTPLAYLLDDARHTSPAAMAWIEVQDSGGAVLAHSGEEPASTFDPQAVGNSFRNRQPLYKTTSASQGEVVAEAFPFLLPQGGFGSIQAAAYLESAGAALWPIRRNLLINLSAALALLVALAVIAFRFRSYVEGKQLEKELEIARQVQQDLLPAPNQVVERFQVAAACSSASGVAGDFHDVFPVGRDGTAFVLGDVSGKGIPAALLMGVIHGAVRSSSWSDSAWYHEEATRQINRLLCDKASDARYASMFWAYYEPATGLLNYINAGHLAPLLFAASGDAPAEPVRLQEGGPVLGLLANAHYQQDAVLLQPGDVLVLYSDGIAEANNTAGEQFGEQQIADAAQRCLGCDAEEIRDEILSSLRTFSGNRRYEDDCTVLVIKLLPVLNSADDLQHVPKPVAVAG